MKPSKFTILAAATLSVTMLSGCSVLYPHWGATDFPTDGPSSTSSAAPSATATASASPSATTKPVQAAKVQIMQLNVDATNGVVDAVAQISNVAEDGGQCVLTVTSGSTSKQQIVRAESNVDTTQCFPMEVSLSGLAKGSASVVVSYKSAGYVGSSPSETINIQ
jgi:hypothetical protein